MISSALQSQLDRLRQQLTPATAGALLCSWWSQLPLPDGQQDTRPRSPIEWQWVMDALCQAQLVDGIVPSVASLKRMTTTIWHDGPLPVALARYRVAVPTPAAVAAVAQAAAAGRALPEPLPPLADLLEHREVFATGIPMHDQWATAPPVVRSRVLVWSFDQRFWCAVPGTPLPDEILFDAGDGQGPREVSFGQKLTSIHPTGETCTYAVTARWGDDVRIARGSVAIGGRSAPLPDETWELRPPGGPTGRAYVYHPPASAGAQERLTQPVVVSEGFPGGWAGDYIQEMANQHGLMDRLLAAGHSVLLLGYDAGYIPIPENAAVVLACLNRISERCSDTVCLGGVSMGGQTTRYALAWLESHGLSHSCRLYFSIDTPHLGSTTSLEVQWFVQTFAHVIAGAADMRAMINTPANRQFLMAFLEPDGVRPDAAHQELLADFAAVGQFPRRPRCIAIASGHGRGGRSLNPGEPLLNWRDHPFAEATLRVSGAAEDPPVAIGACYPPGDSQHSVAYSAPESWEGAPGGQAQYIAIAGALAQSVACGTVEVHKPLACIVPTVSALFLQQDPHLPIPEKPPADSPFQAWATANENLMHCQLSAETAEFLFQEITSSSM